MEEDQEWRVWAMDSMLQKEECEDRRIMVTMWWGWRMKIKNFCRGAAEQVGRKARRWWLYGYLNSKWAAIPTDVRAPGSKDVGSRPGIEDNGTSDGKTKELKGHSAEQAHPCDIENND